MEKNAICASNGLWHPLHSIGRVYRSFIDFYIVRYTTATAADVWDSAGEWAAQAAVVWHDSGGIAGLLDGNDRTMLWDRFERMLSVFRQCSRRLYGGCASVAVGRKNRHHFAGGAGAVYGHCMAVNASDLEAECE